MTESRQQRRARQRAEAKQAARLGLQRLISEKDLVQGWPAGANTTIRLATGADVEAMSSLVELAGVALDEYVADGVRNDVVAGALRSGLRSGHDALLQDIARVSTQASSSGDLRPMYLRSALALVAERPGEGVLGTLLAYPPTHVVERYYQAAAALGPREQYKTALVGAVSLIKIKAVAVAPEAQDQRLGSALLRHCEQVYRQCRFTLLYGQMPPARNLERFYAGNGFEVKEPEDYLDVWSIFGLHGGIHADQGERLFAKWLK